MPCAWPGIGRLSRRGCASMTGTAIRRGRPGSPRSAPAIARRLLRQLAARPGRGARSVVHLPPVLQGAGLARAGDQRGARHSLRRRRGVERAEAGRGPVGYRAARRRAGAAPGRRGARSQSCRSRLRRAAAARSRALDRLSAVSRCPVLRSRGAAAHPGTAPPDRGGDDAAGRQARFLSPAGRLAREAVRSGLVARYRRRRRSAWRGRGGAGPARTSAPLARRARRRREWPPLSPIPTCSSGRR